MAVDKLMHGNEVVTNIQLRCAYDGTLACGRRSAEYFRVIGGYLCSDPVSTYYIFTTYDSARGRTLMIQKRLDELSEI